MPLDHHPEPEGPRRLLAGCIGHFRIGHARQHRFSS